MKLLGNYLDDAAKHDHYKLASLPCDNPTRHTTRIYCEGAIYAVQTPPTDDTMAEQLLDQVRDVAEGQIVSLTGDDEACMKTTTQH